jgi:3-oxoacyl-[acyl-carrier protein] reductase
MEMLLENKNAVLYGGGGAVGGAVARAFAREGASVFLAGRTLAPLDTVAEEISAAGGAAETAQVDALDEQAVEAHADAVVAKAGGIDVSFNAIAIRDVQGIALVEISEEDFTAPIVTGTTAHFLTARAAARRMIEKGSGVILTLSASAARSASSPEPWLGTGGFGVACAAIESFTRSLAGEVGPRGVRVVCLRPHGIPETWGANPGGGGGKTREEFQALLEEGTLLRRLPTLAEVANVAAFMASDQANAMTATVANLTCGAIVD